MFLEEFFNFEPRRINNDLSQHAYKGTERMGGGGGGSHDKSKKFDKNRKVVEQGIKISWHPHHAICLLR